MTGQALATQWVHPLADAAYQLWETLDYQRCNYRPVGRMAVETKLERPCVSSGDGCETALATTHIQVEWDEHAIHSYHLTSRSAQGPCLCMSFVATFLDPLVFGNRGV